MVKQILVVLLLSQAMLVGAAAVVIFFKKKSKLARSYQTRGEVIEFRDSPRFGRNDPGTTVRPVIKFQALDGSVVTFESRQVRSSWNFKVGDQVEILMDRDGLSDPEIKGFMAQWFGTLACAFIAIGSVILALFVSAMGEIDV